MYQLVVDINARIKQAKGQFQAMRDNIFTNKDVPLPERLRYYNALTVNTVPWGYAKAGRSNHH